MDWFEASMFFMIGLMFMLILGIIFLDPIIQEVGARAVCDSHGLELADFKYKGYVQGYSVIRCWAEDPSSSVFRNVGGD